MTRSTRLATLKLVLTLALSSVAVDASAAGLFGWRDRSNESNPVSTAPNSAPAPKASPKATDPAPTDLDSALLKARLSRQLGDFAEATKILGQLVLFAPDDPRVMGEYGKTMAAQGRSDDALAFLERAIQLQPDEWSFHSALGVAYDQKRNYPLAQASYMRALQLKPGETAVLNNAALSYVQSGDLDMAEKLIRQAEANPDDQARIQYTVALVERAKAIRAAKTPAPAPQTPAPAPAVIASLPPPPPVQSQPVTESYQPPIQDTPVASNSLPPLEESVDDWVDVTPSVPGPVVETSSALASLQSNPTVVMQAVPKDDLAGPVQSRAEPRELASPPAKKPTPSPERKQLSVSASPPLTTSAQAAPTPKVEAAHAYYVQAGAFATEERADKMAQSLDSMGARVSPTTVGGRSLYRVRIGPFKDQQQANEALLVAKSMGHDDVKVVGE